MQINLKTSYYKNNQVAIECGNRQGKSFNRENVKFPHNTDKYLLFYICKIIGIALRVCKFNENLKEKNRFCTAAGIESSRRVWRIKYSIHVQMIVYIALFSLASFHQFQHSPPRF